MQNSVKVLGSIFFPQEGTKAQGTTWHYPEVESNLQLHSLLGTPTQDAQQNGKCQTGKDL